MNCINCNKESKNPKFCSRSCAATYNNTNIPKRQITRICTECTNRVLSYRHTKCEYHWNIFKENKIRTKTVGEYHSMPSVASKHPSWANAHVRGFARSWLKDLTKLPCAHCGYNKHVELAHIKAVSDFDDSALLSDINSKENVIQLCPNCHWEFDNLPRQPTV